MDHAPGTDLRILQQSLRRSCAHGCKIVCRDSASDARAATGMSNPKHSRPPKPRIPLPNKPPKVETPKDAYKRRPKHPRPPGKEIEERDLTSRSFQVRCSGNTSVGISYNDKAPRCTVAILYTQPMEEGGVSRCIVESSFPCC